MNKYSLVAILSAVFYALSIPISKLMLLEEVNPVVLGGFTYLGAGVGLLLLNLKNVFKFENPLTIKDVPYTILMVFFDILAIIFLMFGLSKTNSSNVSLLSNFEIVATSLIACLIFKEQISKKLISSIFLIVIASLILTYDGANSLSFSFGSVLTIIAKNSQQVTIIKGLCSGLGSLLIAYFMNFPIPKWSIIFLILLIGFLSYGISVSLYIYSQNKLGAIKTAGYFSFTPYIAVLLSIIFIGEIPDIKFYIALIIMMIAGYLIYKDSKND